MAINKKAGLAAAVSALIGLGAMGQASAGIYAGSALEIKNLQIAVSDGAPADQGGTLVPVNSFKGFDFSVSNTASLPGSGSFTTNSCFGNVSNGTHNCGGTPVLKAASAAQVGSVARASGDTSMLGIFGGSENYANSESVIDNAQLIDAINGIPSAGSHIRQVAEVELNTITGTGTANAHISSTTQTSFSFSLTGTGSIVIAFEADVDLLSDVNDAIASGIGANSDVSASFLLTKNTGLPGILSWSPTLVDANPFDGCTNVATTFTCNEEIAGESLQESSGASSFPVSSDAKSYEKNVYNPNAFYLSVSGLTAGDYTLTLNTDVSAQVTRVPEPGVLALMGAGLLGLGIASRRKKKAA